MQNAYGRTANLGCLESPLRSGFTFYVEKHNQTMRQRMSALRLVAAHSKNLENHVRMVRSAPAYNSARVTAGTNLFLGNWQTMNYLVPCLIGVVWIIGAFAAIKPVGLGIRHKAGIERLVSALKAPKRYNWAYCLLFALLVLAAVADLALSPHNEGDYRFAAVVGVMAFVTGVAICWKPRK
jgi:hypothetical protein